MSSPFSLSVLSFYPMKQFGCLCVNRENRLPKEPVDIKTIHEIKNYLQPKQKPLLLPQKQERSRIQISHSQQPLLPPPKIPLPQPQLSSQPQLPLLPLHRNSKRIIQIQLPQPHPQLLLFRELPHPQESLQPQLVAVKSLIFLPPKGYLCFII